MIPFGSPPPEQYRQKARDYVRRETGRFYQICWYPLGLELNGKPARGAIDGNRIHIDWMVDESGLDREAWNSLRHEVAHAKIRQRWWQPIKNRRISAAALHRFDRIINDVNEHAVRFGLNGWSADECARLIEYYQHTGYEWRDEMLVVAVVDDRLSTLRFSAETRAEIEVLRRPFGLHPLAPVTSLRPPWLADQLVWRGNRLCVI